MATTREVAAVRPPPGGFLQIAGYIRQQTQREEGSAMAQHSQRYPRQAKAPMHCLRTKVKARMAMPAITKGTQLIAG